jgi:hypothetical protein
MNTLELGKYWSIQFNQVLPHTSSRIRTRLAWRLAALSVATDEAFAQISESVLLNCQGGTPAFLDMRRMYLRGARSPARWTRPMTGIRP